MEGTNRTPRLQIQQPANLTNQDYPPSISPYTVEVEEINPPDGQVAVHWRLMTTHEISNLEQALQVLQWCVYTVVRERDLG